MGHDRYQLARTAGRLELRDTQDSRVGAVYVDFVNGKGRHRLRFGGGKSQDIAKAVGLNKFPGLRVIDATAGLGREAFVLASLGCQVILLERSAVVHALLQDGIRRALLGGDAEISAIVSRMTLYQADARFWLQQPRTDPPADVVYLDPMFPERRKSALVQKEMRFFQAVVGEDQDSDALLEAALRHATRRVVVKRPGNAPQLADKKPAFVIAGKTVRYDVYLPENRVSDKAATQKNA